MTEEIYAWVDVGGGKKKRVKVHPADIQQDMPEIRSTHANGASPEKDRVPTLPAAPQPVATPKREIVGVSEGEDGTVIEYSDGTQETMVVVAPTAPPVPPDNIRQLNPQQGGSPVPSAQAVEKKDETAIPKRLDKELVKLGTNFVLIVSASKTDAKVDKMFWSNSLTQHGITDMLVEALHTSRFQENNQLQSVYKRADELYTENIALKRQLAELEATVVTTATQ